MTTFGSIAAILCIQEFTGRNTSQARGVSPLTSGLARGVSPLTSDLAPRRVAADKRPGPELPDRLRLRADRLRGCRR